MKIYDDLYLAFSCKEKCNLILKNKYLDWNTNIKPSLDEDLYNTNKVINQQFRFMMSKEKYHAVFSPETKVHINMIFSKIHLT